MTEHVGGWALLQYLYASPPPLELERHCHDLSLEHPLSTMDATAWRKHKLLNLLQSVALLTAMAALLSILGWIVAGENGVLWALGAGIALILLYPAFSSVLVLQLYNARALTPPQAPSVFRILNTLARRAELPYVPRLYYIPSSVINAFAVGIRRSAAVAVSDGMFQALSERELCGVLAHEISHIRHNDTWVMGLADLFSRLTALFSMLGQLMLLLYVPVAIFSGLQINWLALLVLVFAPTASLLLQLALSRTREYDADLGAAELSGDPAGLDQPSAKSSNTRADFSNRFSSLEGAFPTLRCCGPTRRQRSESAGSGSFNRNRSCRLSSRIRACFRMRLERGPVARAGIFPVPGTKKADLIHSTPSGAGGLLLRFAFPPAFFA